MPNIDSVKRVVIHRPPLFCMTRSSPSQEPAHFPERFNSRPAACPSGPCDNVLVVSKPSVSIVIAAAAAVEYLPSALRAVAEQDYEGPIEVILAAADTETARVARARGVTVIPNPKGTTPTGLNLATANSRGDVLVRVDAQSVIPKDYVSRVVDTLFATGADNVGGMQVPNGETFLERSIAAAMSSPFGAGDARYRIGGPAGPTDTVYLGAFRRSVFERLGGFDEAFHRHQDYELNQRIRASGGTVWLEPQLEVLYRPRRSLTALARQYFQYGRWKRYFARRHPGSLRARHWAPPALILILCASLVGAIWTPWALAPLALYALALLLIGLASLPRIGAPAFLMPVALAVMHVSWGVGFVFGQTRES